MEAEGGQEWRLPEALNPHRLALYQHCQSPWLPLQQPDPSAPGEEQPSASPGCPCASRSNRPQDQVSFQSLHSQHAFPENSGPDQQYGSIGLASFICLANHVSAFVDRRIGTIEFVWNHTVGCHKVNHISEWTNEQISVSEEASELRPDVREITRSRDVEIEGSDGSSLPDVSKPRISPELF